MQNHFYFSSHVLLLFKEWQIETSGVLIGAFVGLFAFTFLYEIAKFYQSNYANNVTTATVRVHLHESKQHEVPHSYGTFDSGIATSVVSGQNSSIPLRVRIKSAWNARYILSSFAMAILVAANYFIMLAVMTYNAWLLIAVCLASGLGYFLLQSQSDIPAIKPWQDGITNPLVLSSSEGTDAYT